MSISRFTPYLHLTFLLLFLYCFYYFCDIISKSKFVQNYFFFSSSVKCFTWNPIYLHVILVLGWKHFRSFFCYLKVTSCDEWKSVNEFYCYIIFGVLRFQFYKTGSTAFIYIFLFFLFFTFISPCCCCYYFLLLLLLAVSFYMVASHLCIYWSSISDFEFTYMFRRVDQRDMNQYMCNNEVFCHSFCRWNMCTSCDLNRVVEDLEIGKHKYIV